MYFKISTSVNLIFNIRNFLQRSSYHSDAKEQHGHMRLQSDVAEVTESPTIVKSKSLSKKIRERQTRDKAASDADRGIPSLYANGTTKSSSMLKSTSHASSLSTLEGSSGDISDDSPPPIGADSLGYLPMATVTPNRSRATSASAPNLDGIASPENAPSSQTMSLPLSWTSTHTNLTNIISSGAQIESVQEAHDLKPRSYDGHNSPPSSQLTNIHLGATSVSICSNPSATRNALNSVGSIAITGNPKVHHANSTTKPLKDPHAHVVERTLPPKSLEKINPAELANASSGSSSSSRSTTHSRAAGGASNSSKLSALTLSPAQTSAKSRAASSSTSTMMSLHGLQNPAQVIERQFLIALEGPPRAGPITVEDDNDRIVQERLLEAKALERGKASGAVMHQFSLWNKVPAKSAPSVQSTAEVAATDKTYAPPTGNDESPRFVPSNRLSSLSPSLHNVSMASETVSTSGKKLRGPKAALANQSLADDETPRSGKLSNPFAVESTFLSSRSHSRTSSSDFIATNEMVRASISTVNSTPDLESNGIVGNDRSFNSDTLDEDYTMEFEPLAGEIVKAAESDICAIPLGGSAGSSLAAALRKKVGGAKQSSSSNESLHALGDGKGSSEGSPVKAHDPLSDRMDLFVTPEKRSNPFASSTHAPLLQSAQDIAPPAEGEYENDNDGWYDDDFAEEDEELRRISERPRSAEGNNKKRSQSEIDTEAVIKSMSQSGPAAFASPRSAAKVKVSEGNTAAGGLTLHAPYARNAVHSGSEKSPDRANHAALTFSAPTSTSDKTSLRRATTTGESRLQINQLEVLGQIEPDSPTAMKSMTSRSASEYNIPSADAVAALNARAAKGSSSKYQTLRNLKSNKSERFQITPMASAQNLLNKTGETTTASLTEVEQKATIESPSLAQVEGPPLANATEHGDLRISEMSRDSAADADIAREEEEQDGDEGEDDRDDASPTLSELSETEDFPEMRQHHPHQQQNQQYDQRQSPLRLEASHTFGTSSAENYHEGLSREQKEEEESPLRWKRGEAIGEGTFGKVYKGMNEKTGELLAIKQLALMDGSSAEVDSLRREISVMWNLEHENIVR